MRILRHVAVGQGLELAFNSLVVARPVAADWQAINSGYASSANTTAYFMQLMPLHSSASRFA